MADVKKVLAKILILVRPSMDEKGAEIILKHLNEEGYAVVPQAQVCRHPSRFVRVKGTGTGGHSAKGENYCPDCDAVWPVVMVEQENRG